MTNNQKFSAREIVKLLYLPRWRIELSARNSNPHEGSISIRSGISSARGMLVQIDAHGGDTNARMADARPCISPASRTNLSGGMPGIPRRNPRTEMAASRFTAADSWPVRPSNQPPGGSRSHFIVKRCFLFASIRVEPANVSTAAEIRPQLSSRPLSRRYLRHPVGPCLRHGMKSLSRPFGIE
jgi:hypothetical protein